MFLHLFTCLFVLIYMLYALCHVFLCFVPLFCSMMMLGLHAHMLAWCCWLCLAWIYVFMCVLPCLCARLVHVDVYVFIPTCLDLCFHMPMCLDLCSLHALCYHPCACMLHAMFICLGLDLVCNAMCYCNPFVPFIVFSCVLA